MIFSITEVFYWSHLLFWSSVYGKKIMLWSQGFWKGRWLLVDVGPWSPKLTKVQPTSCSKLGGDFHQDFFWKLFFLPKYIIGVRWFSQFENFYLVKIVFNQNVSGEKMGMLCSEDFPAFWCIYWWLAPILTVGQKTCQQKTATTFEAQSELQHQPTNRNPKPHHKSLVVFRAPKSWKKVSRFIFSMFRWMFTQNKKLIPKMTWCRCLTATELKALPLQFQAGQVFLSCGNVGFSPG